MPLPLCYSKILFYLIGFKGIKLELAPPGTYPLFLIKCFCILMQRVVLDLWVWNLFLWRKVSGLSVLSSLVEKTILHMESLSIGFESQICKTGSPQMSVRINWNFSMNTISFLKNHISLVTFLRKQNQVFFLENL